MKLLSLHLEKFRNYPELDLVFDPSESLTCITGPNAQGKTNILEAVYLLALTKSFRAAHSEDMIMWNEDYCRVKGELLHENGTRFAEGNARGTLEVFFGNDPHPKKSLKKNNVKISATDFVGNCQIVFFHPEDLNMLYLGPDLRRRYLDVLNIQISRKYFHALKNYKRILQQRNFLLKDIKKGFAGPEQLEIWNDQMVENGSVIIMERANTVKILDKDLAEKYGEISEKKEHAEMKYHCALGRDFTPNDAGIEAIRELFSRALMNSQKEDINAGITTVGPHRDDLLFQLNGRPLACHASRGEYRSLLLSLKLLELDFFVQYTGEKPLLLLDDVFSELDGKRQQMLMNAIAGYQTIITSTRLEAYFDASPGEREHRPINKIQVKEGKCEVRK